MVPPEATGACGIRGAGAEGSGADRRPAGAGVAGSP